MKYETFTNTVIEEIRTKTNNSYNLSLRSVARNNGAQFDGLIIANPNYNIAPTIYLNPYYHRYLSGQTIGEICDDIVSTIGKTMPHDDFDAAMINDFSKAKDSIIYRLVNYDRNKERLKKIPHRRHLDFAITYHVYLEQVQGEYGTVSIDRNLIDRWGIDEDELFNLAKINTPRTHPFLIERIEDVLERAEEYFEGIQPLYLSDIYILSNSRHTLGASVLLYPDILERISNILHSDYVIIPSSIHELIIMPAKYVEDIDSLNEMIDYVNTVNLTDEEVLGDNAYYYSSVEKRLLK